MPRDEPRRGAPSGERPDPDLVDSFLREATELLEPSAAMRVALLPGAVLGDRFRIEGLAGSGGMGTIHRATDLHTARRVAVKVTTSGDADDEARFERESTVLARLAHPAIVRYLAHGKTPHGTRFLVMDWLEGEDLARRLARTELTVDESLMIAGRVCEGLAVAHASGIIHRDLKPSNLWLVDGAPERTTLIDFGIARENTDTRTFTRSGTLLGTVGYMSPEQAMGSRELDARSDLFALGCVLFECLTGRAAFLGSNAVAVLAKVLREDPPLVSELHGGSSKELDVLVSSLLSKQCDGRPDDTGAVLSLLRALRTTGTRAAVLPRQPGITTSERKIVSVILARPRERPAASAASATRSSVERLARQYGAEPVPMRGGGWLVTIAGGGAATDQAAHAAKCALSLASLCPNLRLGVATGHAETNERVPVGAVIDRAARLIASAGAAHPGVAIDELTAGLLGPAFSVHDSGEQLVLTRYRAETEAPRLLMGKPTPFVGRDKELGLLELTLRECVDDGVGRAVLVTGPPGQGKSRLRHEFVRKVLEQGTVRVLNARADPVGAGSAFSVARQLVLQATGVREDAAVDEQRRRVETYLAEVCDAGSYARIAAAFIDLIGAATTDHAPTDAAQLRRAFLDWLAAECVRTPLLIVLEDLHWSDRASLGYLDDALCSPAAKALMVFALARPDVHTTFPELWARAEKIEVQLGRLTPRAAEQLVRGVLGGEISPEALSRVIARADGNAFYLEELIRRVAEDSGQMLPETVLALVHSRLERLEPEVRAVARAASVFGEVFWRGGVATLLGDTWRDRDLDAKLEALARDEVFTEAQGERFAGQPQYAFRHDLLREAAYAMFTPDDRRTGHRLAGDWLERSGEKDALLLAEHFELGAEPKRAASWFIEAAQRTLDGGHLETAAAICQRALACGVDDAQRGTVARINATLLSERGDLRGAVSAGTEAMGLLAVGSAEWLLSAANVFGMAALLNDEQVTAPLLQTMLNTSVAPEPTPYYGWTIAVTCMSLVSRGSLDLARGIVETARPWEDSAEAHPLYAVNLALGRAHLDLLTGNLAGALRALVRCRDVADGFTHTAERAASRMFLVAACADAGDSEQAERVAGELAALCDPAGLAFFADRGRLLLARALGNAGRHAEAIAELKAATSQSDPQIAFASRARLSDMLVDTDDLDAAEREAAGVLGSGAAFPSTQTAVLGALARIVLRRMRPAEALAFADRGLESEALGAWLYDGSVLRLARAEALHALGRVPEACVAIGEARDRVLRIADSLDELGLRARYLGDVPPNARTLALAKSWLPHSNVA